MAELFDRDISGDDDIALFCDQNWMMEAVGNVVKNAL